LKNRDSSKRRDGVMVMMRGMSIGAMEGNCSICSSKALPSAARALPSPSISVSGAFNVRLLRASTVAAIVTAAPLRQTSTFTCLPAGVSCTSR
jgi:hypothetical protein